VGSLEKGKIEIMQHSIRSSNKEDERSNHVLSKQDQIYKIYMQAPYKLMDKTKDQRRDRMFGERIQSLLHALPGVGSSSLGVERKSVKQFTKEKS